MSGEPLMTIVGNAVADAELRYTAGGVAVAAFTVAVTPRVKQGNEWKDGDTTFFRCTVWKETAESVAETVTKGMRLIVHGRFKTRQYEKDGQKRTSVEIDVDEVGPSLRYATARIQKMARSGGGGGAGQASGSPDDPWASSAAPSSAPAKASSFDDEPPF
jgi:single-strand DNA-binding protein